MTGLNEIIGNYPKFLSTVLAQVIDEGLDLDDFVQIDHMCYRTTSNKNYEQKKEELKAVAALLKETLVNGRLITTFRLNTPVIHGPWRVDAIELPAPKQDSKYKEGLEHIEFVLYDDFARFLKKYEGKQFEMRAANRGINPEISLKLKEHSVKFHLLSLPTVVYLEEKLGLTDIRDE